MRLEREAAAVAAAAAAAATAAQQTHLRPYIGKLLVLDGVGRGQMR